MLKRPEEAQSKYEEGAAAFKAGNGLDKNPYGFREGRGDWSRGWFDARAEFAKRFLERTAKR